MTVVHKKREKGESINQYENIESLKNTTTEIETRALSSCTSRHCNSHAIVVAILDQKPKALGTSVPSAVPLKDGLDVDLEP